MPGKSGVARPCPEGAGDEAAFWRRELASSGVAHPGAGEGSSRGVLFRLGAGGAALVEAPTQGGPLELMRAFVELCKPGVTRLVLVMTALGVIAAPGPFLWADLVFVVCGTALVVIGANALNMFLERESDRYMKRTAVRPLPTGRLSPDSALGFGVLCSVAGLFVLAYFASTLAVGLAAAALVSYVLIYTPMKAMSSLSLVVGAVPGALPPAIGYAALTGTVDGVGLWLFLILLVWQLPHFLAITIFRRDEYARAGLRVLPGECGTRFTKATTFAMAVVLLWTTFVPYVLGLAPLAYGAVALVSGLLFVGWAARGLSESAGNRWARTLFFASMPHLVLVMGTLVITAV